MKNVLILNILYSPNIGGVENSIREMSNVFYNNGYRVDVFCSDKNNTNNQNLTGFEISETHSIYRYHYKKHFIPNFIEAYKKLKSIKKNNYSIIISRSYLLVIIAKILGFKDVKYIIPEVTLYSTPSNKHLISYKLKTAIKHIFQFTAFLLVKENYVFSNTMHNQVKQGSIGLVKPTIVYPGVNTKRFNVPSNQFKENLRDILQIPKNKTVLLGLGRFASVKQFNLCIEAMRFLPPEYYLILVGTGPETSLYKQLISNYQLKEKVCIHKNTDTPEHYYQASDIFLMTSNYEPFGQTIIEAGVTGLPIVAFSRSSGVDTATEEILDKYGEARYAKEQTSNELAKCILSIDLHQDISLKKRNSHIISEKFSWANMINEILKIKP